MLFRTLWPFIRLFTTATLVDARCPSVVLDTLPFVLDYAVWRGWHQAVIYTMELETGCHRAISRLIKCLGFIGVATAMDIVREPNMQSHLGVIIFSPKFENNSTEVFKIKIKKLHISGLNEAWFDWLIAARSYNDFAQINKILDDTAIRFDEYIVGAYPIPKRNLPRRFPVLCYNNNRHKPTITEQWNRSKILNNDKSFDASITLKDRKNPRSSKYKNFFMTMTSRLYLNISRMYININTRDIRSIYLVQYLKVRINSTLYGAPLGIWNKTYSMSSVEHPYPVEARKFMGEYLVLGKFNSSDEGSDFYEKDHAASVLLNDVLNFITIKLNATSTVRYYNKLGYQTYEGSWSGLLGALMNNSIDVALEPVALHASRHQDMDFIFPITETMFNIYIRDQETSTVRDVFLAPFNPKLLVCVFAITLFISVALLLISRFTPLVTSDGVIGFTEAIIWSTGILCQQGSSRAPSNPASSVLMLVCLLFALVTYNSYAAFITSVLSVRVATVDTVMAVLQSPNMKIGYIRNGPDQMYLMSTTDALLNAYYIRGYSEAENLVVAVEEGLLRAVKQDYAFFSEQRTARSTLRSLSQARDRCLLRELALPTTRSHLAFPIARGSPYARSILISFLRLRSAGVLARLESVLVPAMPKCLPPSRYASARATDVRSALVLFLIGLITSLFICVAECCWSKRDLLMYSTIGFCRRYFWIRFCHDLQLVSK